MTLVRYPALFSFDFVLMVGRGMAVPTGCVWYSFNEKNLNGWARLLAGSQGRAGRVK